MSLRKNKPNRPYQHGAVLSKSRQARVRAPKSERTRELPNLESYTKRERERGWGGLSNSWQGIRKRLARRCEPRRCSCPGANSTRSCNEAFKRANIDNFLGIFCLSESTSNLRSHTSIFPALPSPVSFSPLVSYGESL